MNRGAVGRSASEKRRKIAWENRQEADQRGGAADALLHVRATAAARPDGGGRHLQVNSIYKTGAWTTSGSTGEVGDRAGRGPHGRPDLRNPMQDSAAGLCHSGCWRACTMSEAAELR